MIYVTWHDLALLICFVLVCTVCIYVILLVRNLNSSVKVLKNLLRDNKDNIDKTLKSLPEISENLVQVSDLARSNLKGVETVIQDIGETAATTAASAQTLKKDILGKADEIFELIELIWRVFFKNKDIHAEKQG